jgi:hypothetical protein
MEGAEPASREELRQRLRKKLGQQRSERVGENAKTRKKLLSNKPSAEQQGSAKLMKSPAYMAEQMLRNPKAMLKKLGVKDPEFASQLTQLLQQQHANPEEVAAQMTALVQQAIPQAGVGVTQEGLPPSFL